MSKQLENLKKKQEEITKKIAEIQEKEEQKEKERILAEKIKEEKTKENIRQKKIISLHVDVDNKLIQNVIESISDIQNESIFSFKKKSIKYVGVDPAHVALYTFKIPSKAMNEYKIKKESDVGIDVEKLASILKRRKKIKNIVLDKHMEHNSLYVSWKTNRGLFKRICPLVDTAGIADPKIPNLNLLVNFDITTKELLEFLKEVGEISDHFSITTSKAGIMFEAIADEDIIRYGIPSNGTKYELCRSLFSSDYFTNAIKSMNLFSTDVNLKIGNDNPIEIRGKNKDGVEMMVLLAPRIESE